MEDGLCSSSSAIQTRSGPSSLLEEWSVTPLFCFFSLCCWLSPKLGEMAKEYRIIVNVIIINIVIIVIRKFKENCQEVYKSVPVEGGFGQNELFVITKSTILGMYGE